MSKDLGHFIKAAESFPLDDVVARYAEDERLPEDVAHEHARELRRFLALAAYRQANGETPFAMRGPIDELWHTFVTFTKKYQEFCERLGAGFIHHFPNTDKPAVVRYGAKAEKAVCRGPELGLHYSNYLDFYRETFGEAAPAHLWPVPSRDKMDYVGVSCGCACGCGCSCIC